MRVALAGLLFSEPDLLLLDEPTNYLDLEGTLWLERYLSRYPHTVVIISHDRDLLNKAVRQIVHLSERKLTAWRGGFDAFERQYREAQVLQEKKRVAGWLQVAFRRSFHPDLLGSLYGTLQGHHRTAQPSRLRPATADPRRPR